MSKIYIELKELEVYQIARKISRLSWDIYRNFDWQEKKIIGDQFIRSADSIGANIAEGYGRFHYLEKIKFYYNARGSFVEYCHWVDILCERRMINDRYTKEITDFCEKLKIKLNNFIRATYLAKKAKQ